MPRLLEPHAHTRDRRALSPWVTLLEDHIQRSADAAVDTFHAFDLADYVTTLAVTADGRFPLVRQYRPALEAVTVELPGGLAEPDEAPVVTALRELEEETGWTTATPLVPLGSVPTDTGRLANRLHCFAALDLRRLDGWAPEPGVEAVLADDREFRRLMLEDGALSGLHLGIVGLALLRGVAPFAGLLAP